jgi:eukaryotic-like serine/threonine-protein kinase
MSPESGASAFGPEAVLGERYRLKSRIASGGMATVWLAHDEELDRKVAIKILSDVLADDPTYAERFRREARVAARVSNPNLVRVFDYSGETERPYIVMQHIAGGTVADRIASGRANEIDPERIARQLVSALAAIHAAGVVHRDVKPSNVLLDDDDDAHLTDFGIAQPDDATQLTATGEVVGTLKYMAPEVLAGDPATERSDLYALGVVLRECLTGREAPKLEALIDRLTAHEPRGRPASATQALALLETYEDRATTATVPLGAHQAASGSRVIEVTAKRALAALAALALVGIIVAIALADGGSDRAPPAGGRDEAESAQTRETGGSDASPGSDTTEASRIDQPADAGSAIPPPHETDEPQQTPAPSPEEKSEHKPPKEEKPETAGKSGKVPPGQVKQGKE